MRAAPPADNAASSAGGVYVRQTDAAAPALAINLGCGPMARPGWFNCDLQDLPGVNLRCDLRRGLPLCSDSADYIAAIHVLQDLDYFAFIPALRELRRVLKPGGILRLGLPDLDRALHPYTSGDARYFHVPDEHARSLGAKLVTQLIWYGSVRTPCNFDFVQEALAGTGFRDIRRCAFGQSPSTWAALAGLDNRERESLFVEAAK